MSVRVIGFGDGFGHRDSSGIGREIEQLWPEHGDFVFGSVLDPERQRLTEITRENLERGDESRIAAEAVWTALTARSPKLRYPVRQGVLLSLLRRFAPAAIFDRSLRKQFQLA